MGFTTGFLGGLTLTYSVLYLSIHIHKSNRNIQHTILQQSNSILNAVIDPPAPSPDPPPYELRRGGLSEQIKDRWNSEIEKMVTRIQTTDWTEQREIYEQKIAQAWSSLRQSDQAKELEQKVKEGVDKAKEAVGSAKGDVKDKVEAAKEKTKEPRLLDLK